uniref:F-box domain-containing protein n=1 Tax=Oryza punctata TaxID=4537 RepID=A0A0E0MCD1_ORYPU
MEAPGELHDLLLSMAAFATGHPSERASVQSALSFLPRAPSSTLYCRYGSHGLQVWGENREPSGSGGGGQAQAQQQQGSSSGVAGNRRGHAFDFRVGSSSSHAMGAAPCEATRLSGRKRVAREDDGHGYGFEFGGRDQGRHAARGQACGLAGVDQGPSGAHDEDAAAMDLGMRAALARARMPHQPTNYASAPGVIRDVASASAAGSRRETAPVMAMSLLRFKPMGMHARRIKEPKNVETVVMANCQWPSHLMEFPLQSLNCSSVRTLRLCFFSIPDIISDENMFALVCQCVSLRELVIGMFSEGKVLQIWRSSVSHITIQGAPKFEKVTIGVAKGMESSSSRPLSSSSTRIGILEAPMLREVWFNLSSQTISINGVYIYVDHVPITSLRKLQLTIAFKERKGRHTLLNFFKSCTELKGLVLWREDNVYFEEECDVQDDDWSFALKDITCLKSHLQIAARECMFQVHHIHGGGGGILTKVAGLNTMHWRIPYHPTKDLLGEVAFGICRSGCGIHACANAAEAGGRSKTQITPCIMTLNSSKLIIPSPSLSKTLSILSHSSWPVSCCKPNLLITFCISRGLMNPSPSPSNTLKASSSSSQLACFSSNSTRASSSTEERSLPSALKRSPSAAITRATSPCVSSVLALVSECSDRHMLCVLCLSLRIKFRGRNRGELHDLLLSMAAFATGHPRERASVQSALSSLLRAPSSTLYCRYGSHGLQVWGENREPSASELKELVLWREDKVSFEEECDVQADDWSFALKDIACLKSLLQISMRDSQETNKQKIHKGFTGKMETKNSDNEVSCNFQRNADLLHSHHIDHPRGFRFFLGGRRSSWVTDPAGAVSQDAELMVGVGAGHRSDVVILLEILEAHRAAPLRRLAHSRLRLVKIAAGECMFRAHHIHGFRGGGSVLAIAANLHTLGIFLVTSHPEHVPVVGSMRSAEFSLLEEEAI